MKITCLEHNIKYELDENCEILMNGNVQGYGAEICWCVTLTNGLKCPIVSDPDNKKAGYALSVNTGGYDAPKDIPGLSHLLEHMLFHGSVTYPGENYYSKYIMMHGGQCNATTFHEKTVYQFDIPEQ